MKTKVKLTIKELYPLLVELKKTIDDDYRVSDDPEEDTPGILITVGYTPDDGENEWSWGWQSGDNSYTGGAYGHPVWGLGYLYRGSNCREVARDIISDLYDNLTY